MIGRPMKPPTNNDLASSLLPVEVTERRRFLREAKSLKLAEQLAREGASEALIRVAGGSEAVEKLVDRNGSLRAA